MPYNSAFYDLKSKTGKKKKRVRERKEERKWKRRKGKQVLIWWYFVVCCSISAKQVLCGQCACEEPSFNQSLKET